VRRGGIDRITAEDTVSLATDVGPVPMQVGVVLVLDPTPAFAPEEVVRQLADRVRAVPRLRRALRSTPLGCGRPIWVDDPAFDVGRHTEVVSCPSSGDEHSLLAVAATAVTTPLPRERPLWRITIVTDLADGRAALIVVFHHVLADGIGGLAVLAHLVDGAPPVAPTPGFPEAAPSPGALAADAWRGRARAIGGLGRSVRRLRAAVAQLRGAGGGARPAPSSLNAPTGAHRAFRIARSPVADLRRVAHAHDATINDLVLTSVAGALHDLVHARGEHVERFVLSVPMSSRAEASADALGNEVGVVPLELPGAGPWPERLAEIAAATRAAKARPRAATSAVINPMFRTLAALRLFHRFIDRQHLVHTFTTNVHGPDEPLRFLDAPITDALALAVVTGNVTVSFAALSYAGMLAVTVVADPDACPDLEGLGRLLQQHLDEITGDPPTP
jgi:WS/DGAT/MGAT family acyltransferase